MSWDEHVEQALAIVGPHDDQRCRFPLEDCPIHWARP